MATPPAITASLIWIDELCAKGNFAQTICLLFDGCRQLSVLESLACTTFEAIDIAIRSQKASCTAQQTVRSVVGVRPDALLSGAMRSMRPQQAVRNVAAWGTLQACLCYPILCVPDARLPDVNVLRQLPVTARC